VILGGQVGQLGVGHLDRPGLPPAMVVDHDPACHRGQPRHQRRFAQVKLPGLAPGSEHRLLDDIFGLGPVSRSQSHHERHQWFTILLIQRRDDRVVFGRTAGARALRSAGPQPPSEEAHRAY